MVSEFQKALKEGYNPVLMKAAIGLFLGFLILNVLAWLGIPVFIPASMLVFLVFGAFVLVSNKARADANGDKRATEKFPDGLKKMVAVLLIVLVLYMMLNVAAGVFELARASQDRGREVQAESENSQPMNPLSTFMGNTPIARLLGRIQSVFGMLVCIIFFKVAAYPEIKEQQA